MHRNQDDHGRNPEEIQGHFLGPCSTVFDNGKVRRSFKVNANEDSGLMLFEPFNWIKTRVHRVCSQRVKETV